MNTINIVFSVYHVKPAASGTGIAPVGRMPAHCKLHSARTSSGDEIWVAAGTYKPTTGQPTDRHLPTQERRGGLRRLCRDGDGPRPAQPAANVTILSGDIDNNDSQKPVITDLDTVTGNTTNSYHVVTGATTAHDPGWLHHHGAAMPMSACGCNQR